MTASAPRTIRVLHVRNSDRFGGPERLLLDQARLAASDLDVTLAAFAAPGTVHPLLDRARALGIATEAIGRGGSYDPRAWRRARALVRRLDPHVVVSHDYRADLVAYLAARDRPRVAVVHGYTAQDWKVRVFEALDRRVLPSWDRVVVPSEALAARLSASGTPRARLVVVPNGVAADEVADAARAGRAASRAAFGVGEDERVLLCLGRLSPEKGQDVLLEAFARTRVANARLVLVGDGALRGALEARAARADLSGRVRLVGWRDDPHACLGAADLLVLPSRAEGLPLAVLEAMAAGVPVVATDVGAVADALDHGRAGRLVPPGDVEALRRALSDALADPEDAGARATRAAARVRERFGAAAQTARLESIFRALVGAGPRALDVPGPAPDRSRDGRSGGRVVSKMPTRRTRPSAARAVHQPR